MITLILEIIPLLCIFQITVLYILTFLELNTKEIKHFIRNRNMQTNIYRLQTCDSVKCVYFCFDLIDFMLRGKSFKNFTNLLLPNNF